MPSSFMHQDLPTLEEILGRKTLPPVCLYNFYIIMRDRLHMEEVLDFYLDVQHHELLWRRYVKTMQRSGFLTEDDLAEGYQSPRVLSRLSHNSSVNEKSKHAESPLSSSATLKQQRKQQQQGQRSQVQEENIKDEEKAPEHRLSSLSLSMPVPLERPSLTDDGDRLQRKAMLNRQDLTDSAQRILLRYLVPSAPKEVTQLPMELRTTMRRQLEQVGRDDPLVFGEAKAYLFEYMRRQAYPKFLRVKVWGNVTLWQQMGRLAVGLIALLAGLSTAFSLIFLDYPRWGVRFWTLLPFWVGVLNIFVFLTALDPLLVLFFNVSETTTFHFNKIRQPQVKRILWFRSIWLLAISLIVAVILTIIFCAVPGRRL